MTWSWNYNMDEAPRDGERILICFVGKNGPRVGVAYWDEDVWTGGIVILDDGTTEVPFTLRKRPPYAWSTAPEVASVPVGWPS